MDEEIPVFRNDTLETVIILPTPQGVTVTLRPGMMVKGKWFERFNGQRSKFVKLSVNEAKTVSGKDLQYEC